MIAEKTRRVVQAGFHILAGEGGVFRQHIFDRVAGGEKFENRLRGDAGASHDRTPVADVGVDDDAFDHGITYIPVKTGRKPAERMGRFLLTA